MDVGLKGGGDGESRGSANYGSRRVWGEGVVVVVLKATTVMKEWEGDSDGVGIRGPSLFVQRMVKGSMAKVNTKRMCL